MGIARHDIAMPLNSALATGGYQPSQAAAVFGKSRHVSKSRSTVTRVAQQLGQERHAVAGGDPSLGLTGKAKRRLQSPDSSPISGPET